MLYCKLKRYRTRYDPMRYDIVVVVSVNRTQNILYSYYIMYDIIDRMVPLPRSYRRGYHRLFYDIVNGEYEIL